MTELTFKKYMDLTALKPGGKPVTWGARLPSCLPDHQDPSLLETSSHPLTKSVYPAVKGNQAGAAPL